MQKLYTIQEASRILSCHANTVRNMIRRGELRAFKVRRVVRVELESFLNHEVGKGGSYDVHN